MESERRKSKKEIKDMWDKEKGEGRSGHRQKQDQLENETQEQMKGKMEREWEI